MIKIKRVYEPFDHRDGVRFLVDRLWPRGIKKEALMIHAWIKEVAPSPELRQWFQHDPDKWGEFQNRYRSELEANLTSWYPILEAHKENDVTLLYSTRNPEKNSANLLKVFLEEQLAKNSDYPG